MIWLLALALFVIACSAWLVWAALTSPIEDPEPSQWDIRDGEF